MQSSLVTVLCSTYNSERWIDNYLKSINDQLLEKFDIIFVDASSTDSSLETIKAFQFREGIDKQIIECDEKIPIYEAWNIAIKKAGTQYVCNINTDDKLYPAGLNIYLSYAKSNPLVDVFYGSCIVVDKSDHLVPVNLYYWPKYSHNILLQQCICGPFPFLKRQTIVNAGLFNPDYYISGDYEMWLRLSKKGCNFMKVSETVGSYFYNPEGISTKRESEHWNEHLRQDMMIRNIYS